MKWNLFIIACILAAYAMLSNGVPATAVAGGLVLAALWNIYKTRNGSRAAKP